MCPCRSLLGVEAPGMAEMVHNCIQVGGLLLLEPASLPACRPAPPPAGSTARAGQLPQDPQLWESLQRSSPPLAFSHTSAGQRD